MSEETRSTADRTMDHFPYFTVVRSSKGQEDPGLPHGRSTANASPTAEIITGEPITFTLRATDPHERPMKVRMRGEGRDTEHPINGDQDVTFEWTPAPDKHRQTVAFDLLGDYEGMHRLLGGEDQVAFFEFLAFPRT